MTPAARIQRAHVLEYLPEGVNGGGAARDQGPLAYRVHLHARDERGTSLLGIGEARCDPRPPRDEGRAAWQSLVGACDQLVADGLPQDASASDVVDRLHRTVSGSGTPAPEGSAARRPSGLSRRLLRRLPGVPAAGSGGARARGSSTDGSAPGGAGTDGVHTDAASAVASALRAALEDLSAQTRAVPRDAEDESRQYAQLQPDVVRHHWSPGPGPVLSPDGRTANVYDPADHPRVRGVTAGSVALLASAIGRGLSTVRTGRKEVAIEIGQGTALHFRGIRPESSSRIQVPYTENKQLAREYLERSGAPTPRGRAFRLDATDDAVAYAQDLGFPVVVKPLAGFGGAGVVAGIGDAAGVRCALDQLR